MNSLRIIQTAAAEATVAEQGIKRFFLSPKVK